MILLNGTELIFKTFPNGETLVDGSQINKLSKGFNNVEFKYENDSDLIKLMFVKKHLDSLNLNAYLRIYYVPYSRMDRVEGDSVFTLKYVAEFINNLGFNTVGVIEPHSDVTPALINKSYSLYPTSRLLDIAVDRYNFDKEKDYLFFPDGGAAKRYGKVIGFKQLIGDKKRDFQTGHIKSLQVIGDIDTKDFKVIILDDLCSKGGTFVLSASKLKELGASEIYLAVTHCENTILEGDIPNGELIDEVLTTDTIINESKNPKIHVIKIQGGVY